MKPLISIILPVYNIESYIERCMNSLFIQTYDNIEMILVDDGSTDDSVCICDKMAEVDKRVKVFHKENGGLSSARNYGIAKANGQYITCVDPDDYVEDDYIEYLYNLIVRYKTRMSICQHITRYDNGTSKNLNLQGDECLETKVCLERMLYHDIIDTSAWAKLYERELFRTVKYPESKIFEDIGTTYALMLQCDYIAVGYNSKYNYMYHNNSIVNSAFNSKKLDLLEMTDKMAKEVLSYFPDLENAVIRRQVYSRFSTINQMLDAAGCDEQRRECIKFIKKYKIMLLCDKKAPKRDKAALCCLMISYRLYKYIWKKYRKKIMGV